MSGNSLYLRSRRNRRSSSVTASISPAVVISRNYRNGPWEIIIVHLLFHILKVLLYIQL